MNAIAQPIAVLQVASYMQPFTRGNGLADVVGSLPRYLAKRDADVTVSLPLFEEIDIHAHGIRPLTAISVPTARGESTEVMLHETHVDRVRVLFLQHPLFKQVQRPGEHISYASYALLSRASLAAAAALDLRPHIVHGHGRGGALVPVFMRGDDPAGKSFAQAKFLYTLHGVSFSTVERGVLESIGIPPSLVHHLEHGELLNIIQGALRLADMVNTVSRNNVNEIIVPLAGNGLEADYQRHHARGTLVGIPNGLGEEWDPAVDDMIQAKYSVRDPECKEANRRSLKREYALDSDPSMPVVAVHARLTQVKGIDIIDEALPRIMELGVNMVVLGDASAEYERKVKEWESRHAGIRVYARHLPFLAHRLMAGADILLHPSLRETDGLVPKMAVKYGTIPVVTPRGGMVDTAAGVGFIASDATPDAVVAALAEAVRAWRDPAIRSELIAHALRKDFSWDASAQEYMRLYRRMLEG